MTRHSTTLVTLACAVVPTALLAGCGGGSSSAPKDNRPTGGAGLNGTSLSNCLTDENWLVAPSEGKLEGLSPSGDPVTVTIYPTAAAATTAAKGKKNRRTAGRTVVSFQAEATSSNTGAEPGTVDPEAVRIVSTCVTKLDQG
jgi:hypothetical protein